MESRKMDEHRQLEKDLGAMQGVCKKQEQILVLQRWLAYTKQVLQETMDTCNDLRRQLAESIASNAALSTEGQKLKELNEKLVVQLSAREQNADEIKKLRADGKVATGAFWDMFSLQKQTEMIIDEQEGKIIDYEKNIEDLQSVKKVLEDRLKKDAISLNDCQFEVTALKAQIKTLEGELKKVKSHLKTKELDLYHAQCETTKQIDAAKSKIRGLEKECSNYAKKNNELRAEIQRLRNQNEEPTIDMNNKLKSYSGEGTLGVVGSVAWFSLDAKLAKLTEENEELKKESEELKKKNQTLNIINVDLKQRCNEVIKKYNSLKEKYLKTVETEKSKQRDPASEVETKSIDQEIVEPMQESKKQDTLVAMQFNTKPKTVVAPAKEETGRGQKHKRLTASKQNKKNLFEYEKPDECNTQ